MSGRTLDDVCELLEELVEHLSNVWSEVEFIKKALEKKEMEIDSKRWKDLMEKLGYIESSVAPIERVIDTNGSFLHGKLEEMQKAIIDAIPDSE